MSKLRAFENFDQNRDLNQGYGRRNTTKFNLIMQTTLLFNFDVLISLVTIRPKRIRGADELKQFPWLTHPLYPVWPNPELSKSLERGIWVSKSNGHVT